MLNRITIKNLAVVDDLEVSFSDGMNVITGETGSGKSLLIIALKLLLGERSEKNLIRTGESSCSIMADFTFCKTNSIDKILCNLGLNSCENGNVIIRRIISDNSNKNFINDEPVTLQVLKSIGEVIVDMHGPYDHQSLLNPKNQLSILDLYGSNKKELVEYQKIYNSYKDISKNLEELMNGNKEDFTHKMDFLDHQIKEIKNANLSLQEEKEIKLEHTLAANSQNIIMLSNEIINILNEIL